MSFFHRLTNAFLLTSLASKVTLISLLFIISALPATLFLTKQNQDLRQRAGECDPYKISGKVQSLQNGTWTNVSGATICIDPTTQDCSNNLHATTNGEGFYTINNVSPGGSGHNVSLIVPAESSVTSQNPVLIDGFSCFDSAGVSVNFNLKKTSTPTPTPTITNTPTPTPTPTVTNTPTPTPTTATTPSATPVVPTATGTQDQSISPTGTPSTTPLPANTTNGLLSLTVALQGITNPQNKDKNITLCFYPSNTTTAGNDTTCTQTTKTIQTTAHFNEATKKYNISVASLSDLPNGNYALYVKTKRFLRKLIPQTIIVQGTTPIILPELPLINGDINEDNSIDTQDYSAYISCFGTKINSASCLFKNNIDLNEDGTTDSLTDLRDYRILIQNITSQKGE